MSKKVFVLVHDYWHHDDSIKPMMDYLFNADYEVTFTKNPNDYFNGQFDLFLSFKDPIENDQMMFRMVWERLCFTHHLLITQKITQSSQML